MCEVMEEASCVRHHKLKIALIFSAMRHFAAELRDRGFYVRYTTLDDPENSRSLTSELTRAIETTRPQCIVITEASEWRVLEGS